MPHRRPTPEPPPLVLRKIVEAADAAGIMLLVLRLDPDDLGVVYVNDGYRRMLGWEPVELPKAPLWRLIDDGERERLRDLYARSLAGERVPPLVETRLIHQDGRRIPVELSSIRVDLDGRPGLVVFCFDIAFRKQAEAALRSSESRFRSLIEHAPDGVVILQWPHILFVNPAAAQLLGFPDADSAIGENIDSRLVPAREDKEDTAVEATLLGTDMLPAAPQYHCTSSDGSERTVEISSIPIEYEGQQATLAFARDVTSRNLMANRLLEADKLAAVGTLAAGVAHEINNPLAYLMLNLEVLARELPLLGQQPERLDGVQRRLDDIRQGAERVKTIVRDLQTFTRKDEHMRGPVDIAAVVEGALVMAQHEIRHRAKLVRQFEWVPEVHGNATRLEQLFINLLVNAAHALEAGDPERDRIEVVVSPGSEDTVVVEIRDTGCGMPEHVRRKVFDPFFTTKQTGTGTGLGLPICRGIVEAVGGDISLTSKPGVGTSVRVVLRAHTKRDTARSQPRSPRRQPTTREVLLVDDDATVAESLACAIREHHRVVIAHGAKEARRALSEHCFDAILCDLVMPGETGMDLYESVKESAPEMARRFVFMTGGAFLPRAEKFLDRVDNPRIDKPFELATLTRVLEQVMGPQEPAPAP